MGEREWRTRKKGTWKQKGQRFPVDPSAVGASRRTPPITVERMRTEPKKQGFFDRLGKLTKGEPAVKVFERRGEQKPAPPPKPEVKHYKIVEKLPPPEEPSERYVELNSIGVTIDHRERGRAIRRTLMYKFMKATTRKERMAIYQQMKAKEERYAGILKKHREKMSLADYNDTLHEAKKYADLADQMAIDLGLQKTAKARSWEFGNI